MGGTSVSRTRIRALKAALVAISLYCVYTVPTLLYLQLKYARLDLADFEPVSVDPSAYRPAPPAPGRYGRGRPHPLASYEGKPLRVTINNLGSRNLFEVPREIQNHVVLLGDSYFFGWGLSDEETLAFALNRLDPAHRYINLALPTYNVPDSVQRYLTMARRLAPPRLIVLQILFVNDVGPEAALRRALARLSREDHRLVLPPASWFVSADDLRSRAAARLWGQVYHDLSPRRFQRYFAGPIDRLRAALSRSRTRLVVVYFHGPTADHVRIFEPYADRLRGYCRARDLPCFSIYDLVSPAEARDRVADGHPSARCNRALAKSLKRVVDGLLGSAPSSEGEQQQAQKQ